VIYPEATSFTYFSIGFEKIAAINSYGLTVMSGRVFIYSFLKRKLVKSMVYVVTCIHFWQYLRGNFLYRANIKYRKALKILISVVAGALLLAGLYMLFKDTILPTLTQRVKELFDYSGN